MTATCPYCNAVLPASTGARVMCTRCGESVALESSRSSEGQIAPLPQRPSLPKVESGRRRWPMLVVVIVLLAAAGGAVLAWKGPFRSRTTSPIAEQDHRVVRPVDVPGLGYLPPSSDAVL